MKEFKLLCDKNDLPELKLRLEKATDCSLPPALIERIVDLLMGEVSKAKLHEQLSTFLVAAKARTKDGMHCL